MSNHIHAGLKSQAFLSSHVLLLGTKCARLQQHTVCIYSFHHQVSVRYYTAILQTRAAHIHICVVKPVATTIAVQLN